MNTFLITGAAQGLGRALSYHLAKNDNHLILIDKDLKTLNGLYDDLEANHQCQPALFPVDFKGATLQHYNELADAIGNNYGKVDALFLNAATHPAFTPLEQFDSQQWYDVIQTNLHANFHLVQTMMPWLKQSEKGKLIAILDENIDIHPAYYGAYGVAKAGLEQMMKTLAAETCENCFDIYTARLTPFQSNMRSRLFPGENPVDLPTAEEMAKHLALIVLEGLQAEFISKL